MSATTATTTDTFYWSPDVLAEVLGKLGPVELCRVACVNKAFRDACFDPRFWRNLQFTSRPLSSEQFMRIINRVAEHVHTLELNRTKVTRVEHAMMALFSKLTNLCELLVEAVGPCVIQTIDAIVSNADSLPRLQKVTLQGVRVDFSNSSQSDVVFSQPTLTHLTVRQCTFRRLTLQELPNLRYLDLRSSSFLALSLNLPDLVELNLTDASMPPRAYVGALSSLTSLTKLVAESASNFCDEVMVGIGQHLVSLEHLNVSQCKMINLSGLNPLRNLRTLVACGCDGAKDENLQAALHGCWSLENVILDNCPGLTHVKLVGVQPLRVLSLRSCANMRTIQVRCPGLRELRLGKMTPNMHGSGLLSSIILASLSMQRISWSFLPSLEVVQLECPALIHLSLTDCEKLRDDTVSSWSCVLDNLPKVPSIPGVFDDWDYSYGLQDMVIDEGGVFDGPGDLPSMPSMDANPILMDSSSSSSDSDGPKPAQRRPTVTRVVATVKDDGGRRQGAMGMFSRFLGGWGSPRRAQQDGGAQVRRASGALLLESMPVAAADPVPLAAPVAAGSAPAAAAPSTAVGVPANRSGGMGAGSGGIAASVPVAGSPAASDDLVARAARRGKPRIRALERGRDNSPGRLFNRLRALRDMDPFFSPDVVTSDSDADMDGPDRPLQPFQLRREMRVVEAYEARARALAGGGPFAAASNPPAGLNGLPVRPPAPAPGAAAARPATADAGRGAAAQQAGNSSSSDDDERRPRAVPTDIRRGRLRSASSLSSAPARALRGLHCVRDVTGSIWPPENMEPSTNDGRRFDQQIASQIRRGTLLMMNDDSGSRPGSQDVPMPDPRAMDMAAPSRASSQPGPSRASRAGPSSTPETAPVLSRPHHAAGISAASAAAITLTADVGVAAPEAVVQPERTDSPGPTQHRKRGNPRPNSKTPTSSTGSREAKRLALSAAHGSDPNIPGLAAAGGGGGGGGSDSPLPAGFMTAVAALGTGAEATDLPQPALPTEDVPMPAPDEDAAQQESRGMTKVLDVLLGSRPGMTMFARPRRGYSAAAANPAPQAPQAPAGSGPLRGGAQQEPSRLTAVSRGVVVTRLVEPASAAPAPTPAPAPAQPAAAAGNASDARGVDAQSGDTGPLGRLSSLFSRPRRGSGPSPTGPAANLRSRAAAVPVENPRRCVQLSAGQRPERGNAAAAPAAAPAQASATAPSNSAQPARQAEAGDIAPWAQFAGTRSVSVSMRRAGPLDGPPQGLLWPEGSGNEMATGALADMLRMMEDDTGMDIEPMRIAEVTMTGRPGQFLRAFPVPPPQAAPAAAAPPPQAAPAVGPPPPQAAPQAPPAPVAQEQIAKPAASTLSALRELILDGCDGLRTVRLHHKQLRTLSLARCSEVKGLALNCSVLNKLAIKECGALRAAGLHQVQLQQLCLGSTTQLAALKVHSPSLQELDLKGSGSLAHLDLEGCSSLKVLDAQFCNALDGRALAAAVESRPPLEKLILPVGGKISSAGIAAIQGIRTLTSLDLSYTDICDVYNLTCQLSCLTRLVMVSCKQLLPDSLVKLLEASDYRSSSPQLRVLDCSYCNLTPAHVVKLLRKGHSLESLALNGVTGVDDSLWHTLNPPGLLTPSPTSRLLTNLTSLSLVRCTELKVLCLGLMPTRPLEVWPAKRYNCYDHVSTGVDSLALTWQQVPYPVLPQLKTLRVGLGQLQVLALSLPSLTSLDISSSSKLRAMELRCPDLASLEAPACTSLPLPCMQACIKQLPQLKLLHVKHAAQLRLLVPDAQQTAVVPLPQGDGDMQDVGAGSSSGGGEDDDDMQV